MVWPLIIGVIRTYSPYVVWPVAAVIGVIGYNIENIVRKDKDSPWKTKSIAEERRERHLEEIQNKDPSVVESLECNKFVPRTIFEKNKEH